MAEEIRNISLSQKKSFSIDNDINRIIQLDTSDLNIVVRLEETYPDLLKLAVEATDRFAGIKESDEDTDQSPLSEFSEILKDIDAQMRAKIDYIFDSKVADICVPTGNLYSLNGGEFKFERIISALLGLYANDITTDFKAMQDRVKKHTAKYTGKGKRRRQ